MTGPDRNFWKGRRVLVTGHTGFKGGWLSLVLSRLGAEVTGYALPPPTTPSLFEAAGLGARMASVIADLRDRDRLAVAVRQARPQIVFHLAAQALVRRAFADPVETFESNLMGTVYLLEALRGAPGLEAAVVVTSDKVYDNQELATAFKEGDRLGGREPYGVSKACAELAVRAYWHAYYETGGAPIATARAGNVIGGGDWAADRLVPDALRAFAEGEPLKVRNPAAVRPWQHVLEPVLAYVQLAEHMALSRPGLDAWNFGPAEEDARPVSWVCDRLAELWGAGARWEAERGDHPYEAGLLAIDSAKARAGLGWTPAWRLEEGLARTVRWHRRFLQGDDMHAATLEDIEARLEGLG